MGGLWFGGVEGLALRVLVAALRVVWREFRVWQLFP